MSNTDSFIEEVNEEVRRDRLYQILRRYGWIAVLAILLIVGGAAWNEYRKAQTRAEAEALGDALLAALQQGEAEARVAALEGIAPSTPESAAVLQLLTAAQQAEGGAEAEAVETLDALATNGEVPQIYRSIAQFKALTLQADTTPPEERRLALEAMAQPGQPLRLLAEEQIALLETQAGESEAAIARYQAILTDAEVSADLQQRALQVIVALGGEPELGGTSGLTGDDLPELEN